MKGIISRISVTDGTLPNTGLGGCQPLEFFWLFVYTSLSRQTPHGAY